MAEQGEWQVLSLKSNGKYGQTEKHTQTIQHSREQPKVYNNLVYNNKYNNTYIWNITKHWLGKNNIIFSEQVTAKRIKRQAT